MDFYPDVREALIRVTPIENWGTQITNHTRSPSPRFRSFISGAGIYCESLRLVYDLDFRASAEAILSLRIGTVLKYLDDSIFNKAADVARIRRIDALSIASTLSGAFTQYLVEFQNFKFSAKSYSSYLSAGDFRDSTLLAVCKTIIQGRTTNFSPLGTYVKGSTVLSAKVEEAQEAAGRRAKKNAYALDFPVFKDDDDIYEAVPPLDALITIFSGKYTHDKTCVTSRVMDNF